MPTGDLAGAGVLITRPAHQNAELARRVEQAGGVALCFPGISIAAPEDPDRVAATLKDIDRFDIAVFVSPNAVEALAALLPRGLVPGPRLAAVGRGSARALERHFGRGPDICPEGRYDSEALLELPALREVAGLKVLLVRGNGGRELIAETLRERGAEVAYAEVYRRAGPKWAPRELSALLHAGRVDIATATSGEALGNIVQRLGAEAGHLLELPLVVVTERMRGPARRLGFCGPILVSARASDEAVMETVMSWAAGARDDGESG